VRKWHAFESSVKTQRKRKERRKKHKIYLLIFESSARKMDFNRSKKTKTVRTLIETNGERYEIQYEVGENEIDSVFTNTYIDLLGRP
jgi:hypothetical protein